MLSAHVQERGYIMEIEIVMGTSSRINVIFGEDCMSAMRSIIYLHLKASFTNYIKRNNYMILCDSCVFFIMVYELSLYFNHPMCIVYLQTM